MNLISSFSQVSTWRGLLGLASVFGVGAVAIWSIIEIWRDERKLDAKDEKFQAKPASNATDKWMGDR